MARTRAFDTAQVLRRAVDLFCRRGFEGTSIDDLVSATGVQRGSLYGAFGSKLGLFVAALESTPTSSATTTASDGPSAGDLDLLLVALLELAHRDDRVRRLCAERLAADADPAALLGDRLLHRAGLRSPTHPTLLPHPGGGPGEGERS